MILCCLCGFVLLVHEYLHTEDHTDHCNTSDDGEQPGYLVEYTGEDVEHERYTCYEHCIRHLCRNVYDVAALGTCG